jgi:hypothetical protein
MFETPQQAENKAHQFQDCLACPRRGLFLSRDLQNLVENRIFRSQQKMLLPVNKIQKTLNSRETQQLGIEIKDEAEGSEFFFYCTFFQLFQK